MASFKTHVSFGIGLGVVAALGVSLISLTETIPVMMAIPVLAAVGAVLPDMDSDSGLPFHIAFLSLTIVCVAMVLYKVGWVDWRTILLWGTGTAVFVWGGVGYVFKKYTRHRGMSHSIPAAVLVGLITFFLSARFVFQDADSFLLALAMVLGFVLHLILDEMYAIVNPKGDLLNPNQAFGSALKFFSKNKFINILVFGSICFLLAGNYQRLEGLAKSFWLHFPH